MKFYFVLILQLLDCDQTAMLHVSCWWRRHFIWPDMQQPQSGFYEQGLNISWLSLFCINLILQKKISATPDLTEGLNGPMKKTQPQRNHVIVLNTSGKKILHASFFIPPWFHFKQRHEHVFRSWLSGLQCTKAIDLVWPGYYQDLNSSCNGKQNKRKRKTL